MNLSIFIFSYRNHLHALIRIEIKYLPDISVQLNGMFTYIINFAYLI